MHSCIGLFIEDPRHQRYVENMRETWTYHLAKDAITIRHDCNIDGTFVNTVQDFQLKAYPFQENPKDYLQHFQATALVRSLAAFRKIEAMYDKPKE